MTSDEHAFYKIVERRRSVRGFEDRPVEKEKLRRILEMGARASTHNHMREWHFIFLRDPDRRRAIPEQSEAFSRAPDRKFLDETLVKIEDPYRREITPTRFCSRNECCSRHQNCSWSVFV